MNNNMKFISRISNYGIVLRHSIPAEPITGRAAIPGLSIKFIDGIVNVTNEDHVKMMLDTPAFGRDYISAEEDTVDPYASVRKSAEPDHALTELEFGHVKKHVSSNDNSKQNKVLIDVAKKMAIEMAKEIAPKMAKEIALEILKKESLDKTSESQDIPDTQDVSSTRTITETDIPETVTKTSEESVPVTNITTDNICDCGFKAKSKLGLTAHQRSCGSKK